MQTHINKNKPIQKGFTLLATTFPTIATLLLVTQTGCNGLGKRLGMILEPDKDNQNQVHKVHN